MLSHLREAQGEYNFAGQYQQAPAPPGGGMVKAEWFKGKYDDQADSTSQALDWLKQQSLNPYDGVLEFYRHERMKAGRLSISVSPFDKLDELLPPRARRR